MSVDAILPCHTHGEYIVLHDFFLARQNAVSIMVGFALAYPEGLALAGVKCVCSPLMPTSLMGGVLFVVSLFMIVSRCS